MSIGGGPEGCERCLSTVKCGGGNRRTGTKPPEKLPAPDALFPASLCVVGGGPCGGG